MNWEIVELLELHEASIFFETVFSCHAIIKVLDAGDNDVRLLFNERVATGKHKTAFSYGSLKAGAYKIKLILNTPKSIEIESKTLNIN